MTYRLPELSESDLHIAPGYRKISWFFSALQILSPVTNHDILPNLVQ